MELEKHKKVMKLIADFEKEPKKFNNSPAKELILERKNIADKEKKLAKNMIEFQNEMEKKLINLSSEMMKLKGAGEYIENKILGAITE